MAISARGARARRSRDPFCVSFLCIVLFVYCVFDLFSLFTYYEPRSKCVRCRTIYTAETRTFVGILCSAGRYLLLHEVLTLTGGTLEYLK